MRRPLADLEEKHELHGGIFLNEGVDYSTTGMALMA
jgi:hypothetical protein